MLVVNFCFNGHFLPMTSSTKDHAILAPYFTCQHHPFIRGHFSSKSLKITQKASTRIPISPHPYAQFHNFKAVFGFLLFPCFTSSALASFYHPFQVLFTFLLLVHLQCPSSRLPRMVTVWIWLSWLACVTACRRQRGHCNPRINILFSSKACLVLCWWCSYIVLRLVFHDFVTKGFYYPGCYCHGSRRQ